MLPVSSNSFSVLQSHFAYWVSSYPPCGGLDPADLPEPPYVLAYPSPTVQWQGGR